MHVIRDLADAHRPAAVALGNFDGIHRGHQQVISPVLSAEDAISTIVTFDPHPREVLTGKTLPALTPLSERLAVFESLGIEQVVLLPFTEEFASQSPEGFISQVLESGLGATTVSVGWDFCFGHRRSGTVETLQEWGHNAQVTVFSTTAVEWQGERVSSSRIKAALAEGDVQLAETLLGRPYQLKGPVVGGDRRGRFLGFPTANVEMLPQKVLPQDGVYCGWSRWQDRTGHPHRHPAVLNIGQRPTFDGRSRTVEVHLLDWSGDLYDCELAVDLQAFLRPEQKFASIDNLKEQLHEDCETAKRHLLPLAL